MPLQAAPSFACIKQRQQFSAIPSTQPADDKQLLSASGLDVMIIGTVI
jgi:hypothetical protein